MTTSVIPIPITIMIMPPSATSLQSNRQSSQKSWMLRCCALNFLKNLWKYPSTLSSTNSWSSSSSRSVMLSSVVSFLVFLSRLLIVFLFVFYGSHHFIPFSCPIQLSFCLFSSVYHKFLLHLFYFFLTCYSC